MPSLQAFHLHCHRHNCQRMCVHVFVCVFVGGGASQLRWICAIIELCSMLARDKAQCCKWDVLFPQLIQDIVLSWRGYACVHVHLCSCTVCVCLRGLHSACACLCQCVHHTLLLWQLGACNTCLLHRESAACRHTALSSPLSLPVSHDGEWSRCWGPIAAQCHFLVLLISSLCCRWLSLKGSTHTHMRSAATHKHACYLLTSPSTALPLAPQWQQRLWLSA